MWKKTPSHYSDGTLGPLALHFETQLNKQPYIKYQQFFFNCGFVVLLIFLLLKYIISQDVRNTERNCEGGNKIVAQGSKM